MKRSLPRAFFILPWFFALSQGEGALFAGGGPSVTSTSNERLFTPPSPPYPSGYTPDPESRAGYNFGIGYERDVRPWLAFGAALNLETRGENASIFHPNPSSPVIEVELRMLYVQLPVLATVKQRFGPVTLGIFGGPSVGRLVHAARERRVNGVSQPVQKAETHKTDLGVEAGATAEVAVGPGAVFLRPGYYWGFFDFAKDHSAKHRAGKLTLGYKYALSPAKTQGKS